MHLFRSPPRLAALFAAALAAGCAADTAGSGAGAFPDAPYATVTSDGGAVTIAFRTAPQQPPGRGVVTAELTVTTADGAPVDGLDLSVVPWMPAMGHGASVVPTVTAESGGRYVVSNVALFMPGQWELRTTVSGAVHDSAVLILQIP
jgi:hypothetical protein